MKLAALWLSAAAAALAWPCLAQDNPDAKAAPAFASAYRGAFVCEIAPGAADILHVPVDLAIRGHDVQFARPLFNLRGSRVVGSELGNGTVGASGDIRLASSWEFRGVIVRADYVGTLTATSGVLIGKQVWRTRDGATGSRTCEIAVAPTFNGLGATPD